MGRILRPFFVAPIVLLSFVTGGDPLSVTGITGGTVKLVFQQQFSDHIKEIVWKFKIGSQSFKIAEFKDNKLKIEHKQFQNRLEIFGDGMGLLIKSVTFNDNGTYTARITLKDHTVHDVPFIVSLHEPVPAPTIPPEHENGTNDTEPVPAPTIQPEHENGTNDTETYQKRLRWPLVFPVLFVLLSAAIYWKKEIMKPRAAPQTHCEREETKLSVQESGFILSRSKTCIDSEEDKLFRISENPVKYQHTVSVHGEIQDDKMAFSDGELPSKFPLQEDSEKHRNVTFQNYDDSPV